MYLMPVDLIEAVLLGFGRGRKQGDRTGDEKGAKSLSSWRGRHGYFRTLQGLDSRRTGVIRSDIKFAKTWQRIRHARPPEDVPAIASAQPRQFTARRPRSRGRGRRDFGFRRRGDHKFQAIVCDLSILADAINLLVGKMVTSG